MNDTTANRLSLPPYTIFPEIIGDQILLRQIVSTDVIDIIEISYYNAVRATTIHEASNMQAAINKDYRNGNSIHWGIADKLTNNILGTCGYYRGLATGEGELGCVLLPQYRGQGYMNAAMLLAIEYGLKTIGLKRIWARTNRQNQKAINLLEKLSFSKVADSEADETEYELRANVR